MQSNFQSNESFKAQSNQNKLAMLTLLQRHVPVLITCAALLSGCGGASEELNALKAENDKLKAENQQLQTALEKSRSTTSTNPAQNTATASSSSSTNTAASSSGGGTASGMTAATSTATNTGSDSGETGTYADIAGSFGEKEIQDLINVGVFKVENKNFEPTKPVSRGEFCKWLVESNNIIRPKKYFIRTADPGSPSSFTDMTDADPYFKYVQGLADAGWSVGFPDKTFRPTAILTREQMIAIKNPIDWNSEQYNGYEKQWSDGNKINPHFLKQMSTEAFAYYQCKHQNNWARLYGATKVCQPQKPVSRAEAAACVWSIGRNPDHGYSAAKGKATE